MNFRFFAGHVVFRTKVTASVIGALGAVMGFEVDRIDDAMSQGWSVLVTGRAERVEDPLFSKNSHRSGSSRGQVATVRPSSASGPR